MSSTPASPPPLGERPDWEHIARYVSGESLGAEHERISAWLAANPEDREVLGALDRLVAEIEIPTPAGLDVEAALLKTKAVRHSKVRPITGAQRSNLSWVAPWIGVAALLTVAAIGGLVLRGGSNQSSASVTPATLASWRAGIGKTDSITLDDGSQVVLAPRSELVELEGFGRDRREVRLKGQGWFRVVHDDAKPFVVHTADAVVRDVGTVFTVVERDDGQVRVAVHEGAVTLRGVGQTAERGVLLHEGDAAVVEKGQVASTSRGTIAAADADWVSGRHRFRDVPLEEVAETLRRWFGLELRITDPALAAHKVTIDVSAASIARVPQELALAVGGELVRSGDTLIVRKAGGK